MANTVHRIPIRPFLAGVVAWSAVCELALSFKEDFGSPSRAFAHEAAASAPMGPPSPWSLQGPSREGDRTESDGRSNDAPGSSKEVADGGSAKEKSPPGAKDPSRRRKRWSLPVYVLNEKEVAGVLALVGFSRKETHALTCTARFESGFNPRAKNRNGNGTQDTGLFQINDVWLEACGVSREDLFDPIVNAKCARKVLDTQGRKAWMAYGERKAICERYKVGDFEKKGQHTIRSILEAHNQTHAPKSRAL